MSQQIINIGTAPNDGTGDPIRTAFTKTNANFTELYGAAVALAYAASLTPALSDGGLRTIALTGAATLHPPTGASAGNRWEGWFAAIGGARTLTIDGAILVPSDSTFMGSRTIASGKTCIILLKYNGTAWMLNVVEGDY